MAKLKQKQCAANGCYEMFSPRNMQHRTHNWECAIQFQKELTEKRKAKDHRRIKKEFKQNDKTHLVKVAQQVFNKYIRTRDKDLPCISCGYTFGIDLESDSERTYVHIRQAHAGYLKPVGGNDNLRFNEDNVHKQCSICNNHKSGNVGEYEKQLILKIGKDRVDALDIKEVKSWTVEELKEIIDTYKQKTRELEDEIVLSEM